MADREARDMLIEVENNLSPARVGRPSKYRDAANFVLKVFPSMDASPPQRVAEREHAARAMKQRRGWLNRRDVPLGKAGYLYLQARLILSGIESLPHHVPVVSLTDFSFGEPRITDVAARPTGELHLSAEIPAAHRRPSDQELMARMGRTMVAGLASAFACEVGMKALLLTRTDQAKRTHDLLKLFEALPEDARRRLEADYRGIPDALGRHRHTFDKWRYLEQSAGESGFGALVDTDRAWELGKAARVILDECVIAGLTGEVGVGSTFELAAGGGEPSFSQRVHLQVTGGEAAVPWEHLLVSEKVDRS